MKLYRWAYCECNKAYTQGDIIVMAVDVHDARIKAMEFARHKVRSLYQHMDDLRSSKDEDYILEFEKKMAEVQKDLNSDPEIAEDGVIFIDGSE